MTLKKYVIKGSKNIAAYGISSVIIRTASFIFLPFYLHHLTLEEFGIWDFYNTLYTLGSLCITTIASVSLSRFYLLYQDDAQKKKEVLGNGLLFICAALTILPMSYLGYSAFFTVHENHFIVPTILNTGLYSLFGLLIAYYKVNELFTPFLVFTISQSVIMLALNVIGISWGFGVQTLFYSQTISFLITLPSFFSLIKNNCALNWQLFKEQLKFSYPFLLYGFIYTAFFSVERLFIKEYLGYEHLGVYGILWRFGTIFQFASFTLFDAWPIILYNAEKEPEAKNLLPTLTMLYSGLLIFISIASAAGSHCLMHWFLPTKFHALSQYIPFFFLPICVLELSRIIQSNFCLSMKTWLIPVMGLGALALKCVGIFLFQEFHLWGIFAASLIAFFAYALMTAFIAQREKRPIISFSTFTLMLGLLTGFTSALQLLDYYTLTLMHLMLPFLVPAAFIFCIFSKEEKEALLSLCLTLIDGSSSNSEPMLTFNDEHTYTKNLFNKKIVILGPTAPPLGGISVHVQRTAAQLRQQKNSVKIFDTTKRSMLQLYDLSKLIFFLLRHRPDHVLYHTHYCGIKQLLAITLLKKIVSYQLMLIDHDCRMLYTQSTSYKKIFSYCQTHIDTTILIGNATLKSYHDNGITFASALIEPAFLAPDLATKSAIMKSYPTSLMQFLAERKPILCMNACQLVLLNNQDLYGVKLTLQALGELKKTNPDVGLIIALAQIGNGSYFQELQQFIQEQNLQDAVCFFGGQKELWPLLAHVDLFLRPTLSDAHSVSICEALYLKTPVLASDAVDRPQECLLFKTGDVGSYVEMLQVALDKRGSYGSIHSSSLHSEEHSPRTEL